MSISNQSLKIEPNMPTLNIKIYRNLMGANDQWAARTRALLKKHHVIMLNLIGSPHHLPAAVSSHFHTGTT